MKKSIYITLALAGILSMNSCNDDEFLPGNPSMEIKAENADALFGDSLPFTIKASDSGTVAAALVWKTLPQTPECLVHLEQ